MPLCSGKYIKKGQRVVVFVNLVRSSATPKAIMTGLLTTKGGFWRKNLSSLADTLDINVDAIINRNPFGLYHFGDPEYKDVFVNGESTQNIYEAVSTPQWGGVGTVSSLYGMQDAPEITIPLFGKTVWDALTICGSVSPDFIVSTAPFGFRSTIFHGHPRFYYAYEYLKDGETKSATLNNKVYNLGRTWSLGLSYKF